MIDVNIDSKQKLSVSESADGLLVDGILAGHTVIALGASSYKVLGKQSIFDVELVTIGKKEIRISINNRMVEVQVADHIDPILEKLGMDTAQSKSIKEIKAPMPGTILEINIAEGDNVSANDPLLVLEAMKMENVIKAPGDAVVGKIHISPNQNVEKNQVLISFG